MAALSRLLLVILMLSALQSCNKGPATVSDTSNIAGTNGQSDTRVPDIEPENKDDAAKSPGQYENVVKDAEECKQGRYNPGSHGGKLNVITDVADPKTFNPWVADDSSSFELSGLLFRSLGD